MVEKNLELVYCDTIDEIFVGLRRALRDGMSIERAADIGYRAGDGQASANEVRELVGALLTLRTAVDDAFLAAFAAKCATEHEHSIESARE